MIQLTVSGVLDSASLPPWAGFCLFCLCTAVVLGLAARRMHRRDA